MKAIDLLLLMIWPIMILIFAEINHKETLDALPQPVEYDYIIELEGNTDNGDIIKISSDGGEGWYIIHPDSLEEFIAADNI